MIQKKRILIGTDFGATIPVQIILMSFVNGLEDWYDYEWKRNEKDGLRLFIKKYRNYLL